MFLWNSLKGVFIRNLKRAYVKDATKFAYSILKQNSETANRENTYYDGFEEKNFIVSEVCRCYGLPKTVAEDIYFIAVRLMDAEWRKKQ
jgi:hypothetical protein